MRTLGIADLARVLSPSGYRIRNQVFALLSAYFDKSSDQPQGITSVAGYVATLDEWEAVEDKWKCGIEYWSKLEGFRKLGRFHMTELRQAIGNENADLCVKYFSNIITQSRLHAIGAAILDVDWHKSDWGDDKTVRLGSTYEQCLDLALKVLGESATELFPGQPIAVFCCKDDKNECIEAVYFRRRGDFQMFGTLAIDTSDRVPLLQCADLGAGRLRQSWGAIAKALPEADALPWGELPSGKGTSPSTSFWSLRQGAVLERALKIHGIGHPRFVV